MKHTHNPSLAEIVKIARRLTDGSNYGMLASLDAYGSPRMRWMGSVVARDFHRILALTTLHSRKVSEIRIHPQVQWMFSDIDLGQMVNFSGQARVLDRFPEVENMWKQISRKDNAWFVHHQVESLGMALIDTTVESMEYSSSQPNIQVTLDLDEIRSTFATEPGSDII